MKFLFLILSVMLFNKNCAQNSTDKNTVTFEYSAVSRKSSTLININNKRISVKKNGDLGYTKQCQKNDWDNLIKNLKTISIKNIRTLEAPSKKRLFDGAAIANLSISYNDSIYKTPSFDHGNPPEEIAKLVKEILSISENIE